MMNLAAALLASFAAIQQVDTTFAVEAGSRLEVNQYEGSVRVVTWERAEMRVQAELEDSKAELRIRKSGSDVKIEVRGKWGEPAAADLVITAPRDVPLEISGVTLEIVVEGAGSDVSASSVEGGVTVTGGDGNIALNAVEGDVRLAGARGNIAINAVDGDVSVTEVEGTVEANAVDGDLTLEGIRSDHVEANSVDGDITYVGSINDGGRYLLSTHDGDLYVTIPEGTNARVSVATFAGELEADFPVSVEGDMSRKRFSFTLGTGKALVELSAFDGTIRLVRP